MPIKLAKPIALIANSYHSGRQYLYNKFKSGPTRIFRENHMRYLYDFNKSIEVIIITHISDVDGREFSGFWIHPEYQDELVASVIARVKNDNRSQVNY